MNGQKNGMRMSIPLHMKLGIKSYHMIKRRLHDNVNVNRKEVFLSTSLCLLC